MQGDPLEIRPIDRLWERTMQAARQNRETCAVVIDVCQTIDAVGKFECFPLTAGGYKKEVAVQSLAALISLTSQTPLQALIIVSDGRALSRKTPRPEIYRVKIGGKGTASEYWIPAISMILLEPEGATRCTAMGYTLLPKGIRWEEDEVTQFAAHELRKSRGNLQRILMPLLRAQGSS